MLKGRLSKPADCNLTSGFSSPKSSRDIRETFCRATKAGKSIDLFYLSFQLQSLNHLFQYHAKFVFWTSSVLIRSVIWWTWAPSLESPSSYYISLGVSFSFNVVDIRRFEIPTNIRKPNRIIWVTFLQFFHCFLVPVKLLGLSRNLLPGQNRDVFYDWWISIHL